MLNPATSMKLGKASHTNTSDTWEEKIVIHVLLAMKGIYFYALGVIWTHLKLSTVEISSTKHDK